MTTDASSLQLGHRRTVERLALWSTGDNGSWLARYRPVAGGAQKTRTFARKVDAKRWLDETNASIVTGMYVDPKTARTTVEQWCTIWLGG